MVFPNGHFYQVCPWIKDYEGKSKRINVYSKENKWNGRQLLPGWQEWLKRSSISYLFSRPVATSPTIHTSLPNSGSRDPKERVWLWEVDSGRVPSERIRISGLDSFSLPVPDKDYISFIKSILLKIYKFLKYGGYLREI